MDSYYILMPEEIYQKTDISEANILNKRRVQIRALDELLQYRVHNIIKPSVLESTLGSLGQRSADRERDNDIVRVLLRAAKCLVRLRLQVTNKETLLTLPTRQSCPASAG